MLRHRDVLPLLRGFLQVGNVLLLTGYLGQQPLKDLVGPVQLSHRQDHIHQLAPFVLIPNGAEQQLLFFCQLFKLTILLRSHGELTQIPGLPQHFTQIDLPGELLMVPGQGQGEGQQVLQRRSGQPDSHFRPRQHHTHHLVCRLTASYVHRVSPPLVPLYIGYCAPFAAPLSGSPGI